MLIAAVATPETARSVVEQAAKELGVAAEGKPLIELARLCIAALGL